ncbi:hypothetical protein N0V92_013876, partial [Colletotrichum tropicale]
MRRIPTRELARYLFNGQISRNGCLSTARRLPARAAPTWSSQRAPYTTTQSQPTPIPEAPPPPTPFRKKLKEEKKLLKKESKGKKPKGSNQTVPGWELT